MKKKYIIRKNEEIQKIVKNSRKLINKYFIVYFKENELSYNRYCVSVSKKIGNSVVRHKCKRQINEMIRNICDLSDGYDIIIIARLEDSTTCS